MSSTELDLPLLPSAEQIRRLAAIKELSPKAIFERLETGTPS